MFGFYEKRNTQLQTKLKDRVFLDYASTTPISTEVWKEMEPFFIKKFHNPSSIYEEGVFIKKIIENYRVEMAKFLQVKENEIYFTSGGTESNNSALLGIFEFYKKELKNKSPHFIISNIEHPSVLEVAKEIERRGGEVSYLKVDEEGLINLEELKKLIKENTVLISIIYANNEIGVLQPISKIARVIKKYKTENKIDEKSFPFLHTDASQTPNYLSCNCDQLGVDLMTLDGSKIYGPKGSGCLVKKNYVEIENILFGGGQEKGLRSGTENVPSIVGFAKAFIEAQTNFKKENERMTKLRDYFLKELKAIFPDLNINGSIEYRIANNLNICFEGIDAEFEVIRLDKNGLSCAYTTACKTLGDESKSYVVEALNKKGCAYSSLRFTLGKNTNERELKNAVEIIKKVLKK